MSKKPAVIFLLDWLPVWWSTREEFHGLISGRLADEGVVVILVVARPPAERVVERFEQAGAKVLALPYEGRFVRYWRKLKPLFHEYDVRVAHVRFFDYFSLVPWICKLLGAPLIAFTESNSGEADPGGRLRSLRLLRTRLALSPVHVIVAISDFIRRRMVDYGAPADKIVVIHNGIDIEGFRPDPSARSRVEREFAIQPGEFIVVFMASLVEWKRPELAIRACAKLRQRGVPVRLLMCGKGRLKRDLEDLCNRLRFAESVVWAGHYPDPHRIFQACDAFLHTAVGEAFGNVLAEAMACRVPVVGVNRGAIGEIVARDATGLLVESGPDEADDLAEALATLHADPEMRRRFGEAGRDRAANLFSLESAVERTLETYRGALSP